MLINRPVSREKQEIGLEREGQERGPGKERAGEKKASDKAELESLLRTKTEKPESIQQNDRVTDEKSQLLSSRSDNSPIESAYLNAGLKRMIEQKFR